ncbi:globin family protein [Anthocerotibacter panamensis]|uniref:globin family protein n=1 Tax=Anthocerotibacter panamensis TaxID=2857077 RepID=UPI001C40758D|nr:globin family protein [Anthocerotibacter panamensis]
MSLNVELLEQSFNHVQPAAEQFSATFYETLFTDYPQVQPLFANSDMKKQQKLLFASVELVVANLRKPNVLTNALKDLGQRHVQYGVIDEHYPMVGAALLKTFALQLGSNWTPEVESAWLVAFEVISQLMQVMQETTSGES